MSDRIHQRLLAFISGLNSALVRIFVSLVLFVVKISIFHLCTSASSAVYHFCICSFFKLCFRN